MREIMSDGQAGTRTKANISSDGKTGYYKDSMGLTTRTLAPASELRRGYFMDSLGLATRSNPITLREEGKPKKTGQTAFTKLGAFIMNHPFTTSFVTFNALFNSYEATTPHGASVTLSPVSPVFTLIGPAAGLAGTAFINIVMFSAPGYIADMFLKIKRGYDNHSYYGKTTFRVSDVLTADKQVEMNGS